ncbi:MAG TPA: hypothetical protein ENK85_12565, partial [Saprospiraceae bacterium]|nr:hypothetical protein [Saprospiraceae bacterium]
MGGGVILNAQPQFLNADFEQSPSGQVCQGSKIGLVGWTFNAANRGGICNSEKVCNGNKSLEFAAYNGGWKATTLNPMSDNSISSPYTVRFKCTPGFIVGEKDYIKAYGTNYINGPETFLGEVEIAKSDAPCSLKTIDMPNIVSEFKYFVLKMEDNPGFTPTVSGTCIIDDIEVLYLCTRKFPEYTVHNDANWQTVADVEADIPGSTFGGEVYLSGLNIAPYKKLTIGSGITIHFTDGAHLLMWHHSKLDLFGTLTSCDNRWGGVRTYSNSIYRSFGGSELSNAIWGISSEEWGNYLGSATVESYGGLFLNNAVAIHLYGPSTQQNGYQLLLQDCLFKKDANFDPTGRFWGFISLNNMDTRIGGSGIFGCHFKNENPTNNFNFGIESYDSDFLVSDYN